MKTKPKKTKFTYLFLSLLCLFMGQNHISSYWTENDWRGDRSPSSSIDFNESEEVLSDLFNKDHKMKIDLWTNSENRVVKKLSKKALLKALKKTLPSSAKEYLAHQFFKNNLIQTFSSHFLDSLSEFEIEEGVFQIDINFEPSSYKDLEQFMKSNNNIDHSQRGMLLNSLYKVQKTFDQKVLSFIPSSQESPYHPLGGAITLWFNLSKDSANKRESFIKYRRYFSVKKGWSPRLKLKNPKSELDLNWKNLNEPRVITADITKELSGTSHNRDKIEIFFGVIKHPKNYYLKNQKSFDIFSEDRRVNTFVLKGEDFSLALKKLEFRLADQEFSQNSQIVTNGDWKGYSLAQKRILKSQIRRSLLGAQARDLIKELNLHRFEHTFKQVGEK